MNKFPDSGIRIKNNTLKYQNFCHTLLKRSVGISGAADQYIFFTQTQPSSCKANFTSIVAPCQIASQMRVPSPVTSKIRNVLC